MVYCAGVHPGPWRQASPGASARRRQWRAPSRRGCGDERTSAVIILPLEVNPGPDAQDPSEVLRRPRQRGARGPISWECSPVPAAAERPMQPGRFFARWAGAPGKYRRPRRTLVSPVLRGRSARTRRRLAERPGWSRAPNPSRPFTSRVSGWTNPTSAGTSAASRAPGARRTPR